MDNKKFKFLMVLQIITLFIVIIILINDLSKSNSNRTEPVSKPIEKKILPKNDVFIDSKNDFFIGNENADNFLIVYSNYTCEMCRYFYKNVIDSLQNEYIDSGKLKVIFKDFVSEKDKRALFIAKIAEIAKRNDRFIEFHNRIINEEIIGDSTEIAQIALEEGISEKSIIEGLKNMSILNEIITDTQSAKSLNIGGTPSFVLNGKTFIGYLTFEDITEKLN